MNRRNCSPPAGLFDGVMRVPLRGPLNKVRATLGEDFATFTNAGFCGHVRGKSLTRTGRKLRLGVHGPQRRSGATTSTARDLLLCHFDGMTPQHWVRKLQRSTGQGHYAAPKADRSGRHRVNQLIFVREKGADLEVVQDLHDRLRVVSPQEGARLTALGLTRPMPIDPAVAVDKAYGAGRIDLSVARFDAALDARAAPPPAVKTG